MITYTRYTTALLGLLTWLALCYHGTAVQAQEVTKLEYYFDNDPGFGKGQNVPITSGMDVTKTFAVDINSLSLGFHNLYVRALVKQYQVQEGDATVTKGGWSLTSIRTFYKENLGSGTTVAANIVKGEYFIGIDPGFGKGVNIPLTPGQNLSNLTFAFDITSLPVGFHNLYVRFKDANQNWGMTSVRTFYKENFGNNNGTPPNIVKGEFFIDADPGFGKGTNIAITPGADLSSLTFTADISSVPAGFHQLYTRFKDANGNWGQTNVRSIYKEVFSTADPLPNLVKAEYFVDTDPGFGRGTNIPVTLKTEINNLTFALDMTDISIGNHKLYVRVQDANGKWSLTSINDFEVESPQELYVTVGTIADELCAGQQVEVPYTVNAPFGSNNVFTAQLSNAAGNFGSPVTIGTLQGRNSGVITANIPENTVAGSAYRIRVVASSPMHTSLPNSNDLTIKRVPLLAGITGDASTCLGMKQYSMPLETGVTYEWRLSGGGTLTATGNTATVTWSSAGLHTITVTPSNDCGNGQERTLQVNVYDAAPAQTPTISASGRWLYASAAGSNVSGYQWYVNGGAISGANSSSFYVYDNGLYTVRYSNPCGNGPESNGISFSGDKQNQTISFTPISEKTYGDEPFALSATASSGLPVSFSIISGPATVSENTVTITGAGNVIVRASQAGDNTYNAATPVDNSFVVKTVAATVTITNVTQTYNGQPRPVSVTTSPAGLSTGVTYDGSSTVPVNAGSYAVVATITNPNYTGSNTATLVIEKAQQSITLESVPTKTYGDGPFNVLASASSGLAVNLSISTEPTGIATISGNTITITGAGTVTLTAKQEGNVNYLAAVDVSTAFTVNKASQTIAFAPLADKTYGDAPFDLNATASSGLGVSFSIVSGPATISGNALTMTGIGTVVVRASQSGNDNYLAALDVDRSFQVKSPEKLAQSIAFAALSNRTYGDGPVELAATASSGLAVSFNIVSGPVSIAGNTLTILGAGTVTVEAKQAGNETYDAATPVSRSFTVFKATPVITWNKPSDVFYGTALSATQLNATTPVPGAFSYSPAEGTVLDAGTDQELSVLFSPQEADNYNSASASVMITVNPAPVTFQFEGLAQVYNGQPREVSVTTYPAGIDYNLTYDGGTDVPVNSGSYVVNVAVTNPNYTGTATATLIVNKASQNITFAALADKTYGDAPFELSASASSGLVVQFSVLSGPATITGNTLTMTGTGIVTVRASQEGNANYLAASGVDRSFNVAEQEKLSQVITFESLSDKTYGDAPFELKATASSGLLVSYAVTGGPAIVNGNMLTINGAGTVTVEASQPGNDEYKAASPVTQSFSVAKASQSISFAALPDKTLGDAPFALAASASSGLPVSYSMSTVPATGVASLSGNIITLLGATGTVTVTTSQGGNDNYLAAGNVEQNFSVSASCNLVSLSFTGAKGYETSWVEPKVGAPGTTFFFEAIYTDAAGNMPKPGFPKLQLDYNNDGDYLDPQDRVVVMVPANGSDMDVTDGKRYVAQVNNLLLGQYSASIVVESEAGCTVTSAKQIEPLVSDDLLDLAIYANDITFSNGEPEVNEAITISATIHNQSDFTARNFVVNVFAEDQLLFTQTVASLAAQSQTTLRWQYAFSQVQFYPIKVVVDATDVLAERNELNNFAIRPVVVGGYNVLGGIAINAAVSPDPGPAFSYATLEGSVQYEEVFGSDFDVSGAEVRAQIVETGQTLQTYTDANGNFKLAFARPSAPGTYHFQIKATDFTLTGKSKVAFTVTAPVLAVGPNLSAGFKPLSCVAAGTTVSDLVTIYNSGNQAAGPFQVRLYRETGTLSVTDIPGLSAGASITIPVTTSYAQAGNYQIFAVIDEANQVEEQNENDNNSSVLAVNVVPNQPDLVIQPFNILDGQFDRANPNAPASISVKFSNQGGQPAGAFHVKVYLGTTLIHTESISGLEACSQLTSFSFPYVFGAFGTYTLTAVLDEADVIDEALEDNNIYTYQFVYPVPEVNLTMSRLSVVPAEPVNVGDPLTLVADYGNNGYASISVGTNFAVRFNLDIAGASSSVTQVVTDGVAYQTNKATTTTISTPSFTDNKLTVNLDADNQIVESSELDNAGTNPLCWDFTLGSCPGSVPFWQSPIYANSQVNLLVGMYNKGLYQGSNLKTAIYVNGELYNVQETATLAGLGTACIGATYRFAEPGEYTIRFVADMEGKYAECDENNNVLEVKVNVLPQQPDLQILSQQISPTELNPDPNEPVQIFLSFKNIGSLNAGPFRVRGAVNDVTLGETLVMPGLRAGRDTTVALTAPYSSTQIGAHIIRGIVDILDEVDESNELNNEASRAIIMGEAANLLFTGIAYGNNCPMAGSSITLTPTVKNEGDLAATGVLRLYYVTSAGDTTLIQAQSVSVGPKQSVPVQFQWQVLANATSVYAELVNTSPMEFNYLDNSIGQSLCPSRLAQTITFDAIPGKTYGDDPFTLNAATNSGLPVTYSLSSVPEGIATISGNTVTIIGTGQVTVTASQVGNDVYNPASDVVQSFTVEKATPSISWATLASIAEGTALSDVQLNATASFKGSTVPGTFTYNPAAGSVMDAGNNQELSVDFEPQDASSYNNVLSTKNYITVNGAPVLAVTGETTVKELELLTLNSSATDANGDVITFSLQGNVPVGMVIGAATGTITWTPSEAQGPATYSITVRATDNNSPVLYAEQTLSLTVEEVNQAPVLATIPAQSFTSGETVSFVATATDTDLPVQQLTYSLVSVPGENFPLGATINAATGSFQWSSVGHTQSGYGFKVRVEDSYGAFAEQQVSMTLRVSNQAPVLADIGDKSVVAGTRLAFIINASDDGLPNGVLTFSATDLPKGAALNASTGAFSWTPTGGQLGTYTVTFSVTDGSLSDTETITIDVVKTTAGVAPQINSFSPTSGIVGTMVTILGSNFVNVNAVLFNGAVASYSVLNTNTIEAIVPSGATTGSITVSTTGGSVTSRQKFTMLTPVISGFTPGSGPVGTIVTITGNYFVDVTSVTFNGIPVVDILSSNATELMVRVPAGATSGKIGVTTTSGATSSKGRYNVTGGLAATTIATFEIADEANFMAYPNPFNGKTTISFVMQEEGAYTVSLYDAKGALISTLKQGKAETGQSQRIELDGTNLDKGLYLIKLQTADKVQTLKIVLDK